MFVIIRSYAGRSEIIDGFVTEEEARVMIREFWLKHGSWGTLKIEEKDEEFVPIEYNVF